MPGEAQSRRTLPLEYVVLLSCGLLFGRLLTSPQLLGVLNAWPKLWPSMSFGTLYADLITIGFFLVAFFVPRWWRPEAARQRFVLISLWAWALLGGLAMSHTIIRTASQAPRMTHDGVVQSEYAARFMLAGVNPYAADYRSTGLDKEVKSNVPASNSLFTHYVYPPLIPILTVPLVWIADTFHVAVEPQYVYFGVIALCVILLLRRIPNWTVRTYALLGTIGNPFLTLYAVAGYNDAVAFGLLATTAILMIREKWGWAGVTLGLAIAAKQTAWFFLPLWVLVVWSQRRQLSSRTIWSHVGLAIGIAALLYIPFIINNPTALFDDLIRFPSGTIPGSYPIGGATIWQFAVIHDPQHYIFQRVPSQIVQAIVGILTFGIMGWRMWRHPSATNWLLYSAITLLIVGVVNRYNFDNYTSGMTLTIVVAILLERFGNSRRGSLPEKSD